jgi:hypothetical protein
MDMRLLYPNESSLTLVSFPDQINVALFYKLYFSKIVFYSQGTWCATNRKVADSIPEGAIGIYH